MYSPPEEQALPIRAPQTSFCAKAAAVLATAGEGPLAEAALAEATEEEEDFLHRQQYENSRKLIGMVMSVSQSWQRGAHACGHGFWILSDGGAVLKFITC